MLFGTVCLMPVQPLMAPAAQASVRVHVEQTQQHHDHYLMLMKVTWGADISGDRAPLAAQATASGNSRRQENSRRNLHPPQVLPPHCQGRRLHPDPCLSRGGASQGAAQCLHHSPAAL